MRKLLFIIYCIITISRDAYAQRVIPKDTSFTVYSSFIKEKKKFPFITVADPVLAGGVRVKENILYSEMGGRQLLLDIFYPHKKTGKKYPAVLLVFGGGWKSGDKSQNVAMAKELARNGFVAVSAEYRLSPEARFPAAVHDLKAAIRWMRAHAAAYQVDKNKIAILGCSAGGQLAALVGTTTGNTYLEGKGGNNKQSSAVQAIIDIDGILAFKHPESAEGVVAAEWLGGTYEAVPLTWALASPLTHTGKSTPPILFINSSFPRFHAGRTDMISKLDSLHIYSEIHELPETPHPFWFFHPWFEKVISYTTDFLNKIFGPGGEK